MRIVKTLSCSFRRSVSLSVQYSPVSVQLYLDILTLFSIILHVCITVMVQLSIMVTSVSVSVVFLVFMFLFVLYFHFLFTSSVKPH